MRLLNALFENSDFIVDAESVPYIVRDVINMNWWNTCDYLLGYQKNKRVSLTPPTRRMKLIAIILKEFYRHHQNAYKNEAAFRRELDDYILGKNKNLRQLKLYSMDYRRNDSQYFYINGKPTWLDCTSRATYAWKYVAQNGYVDFDDVCRVIDGQKIINHCQSGTVYPYASELMGLFAEGENQVKKEIFSQRKTQNTVAEWVERLKIKILPSREWLFEKIAHVKTDPYKNHEKELLIQGKLTGNNELLYGYKTSASTNTASHESNASGASDASRASRASDASNASGASHASRASDASRASYASQMITSDAHKSWFSVPAAIGEIKGLEHPIYFKRNKFGIAGHWKINEDIVRACKIGWLDPYCGHGESPLFARKLGKKYVGIEINPDSMNGYILPFVQTAINNSLSLFDAKPVEIRLGDSAVFMPDLVDGFDLCYTSPPYFDFEDYGYTNKTVLDCKNYEEYHRRVTVPVFTNVRQYLVDGGILALQTEKDKKLKNKWIEVIAALGYALITDTVTGQEDAKYSQMSKRDQTLLIFKK